MSVEKPNPERTQRPNIVLILADDMGFSDLGSYGGEIRTPNLDRLAADGLRFTQFCNCGRCCPTRASLLTGLYPHEAGVGGMVKTPDPNATREEPYQGYLNRQCVTFAEVLREAGYQTMMSGKWHVGETRPHWPLDRGFDRYWGLISGAANYFDIRKARPGAVRVMAQGNEPFIPEPGDFYMTDAITEQACAMVDDAARRDNPFLLYLAYTAPHFPLQALEEDIERYRGRYRDGWEALRRERFERIRNLGLFPKDLRLSPLDAVPWQEAEDRELCALKMAVYAAQVDRMDQGIGRLIALLKANGTLENTLVLFLSDNGACAEDSMYGFDFRQNGLPPGGVDSYMSYGRVWANACNTPFRKFKRWAHEGGIRTPLIAHWPAVIRNPGAITHQAGHVMDFMATFIDIAETRYPDQYNGHSVRALRGKSLLPVFRGEEREGHASLCWEHIGHRAIREGDWKLVAGKDTPWELFDLSSDVTELDNLAGRHPDRVAAMSARYAQWAAEVGV